MEWLKSQFYVNGVFNVIQFCLAIMAVIGLSEKLYQWNKNWKTARRTKRHENAASIKLYCRISKSFLPNGMGVPSRLIKVVNTSDTAYAGDVALNVGDKDIYHSSETIEVCDMPPRHAEVVSIPIEPTRIFASWIDIRGGCMTTPLQIVALEEF
ncbi:MAG: hypothetical protein ABFD64_11520 [Armatimonadota bacterium]